MENDAISCRMGSKATKPGKDIWLVPHEIVAVAEGVKRDLFLEEDVHQLYNRNLLDQYDMRFNC